MLRHLEAVGFRGAPRLVGRGVDDAGRQILTYVDGELVRPYAWSSGAVAEAIRLNCQLHGEDVSALRSLPSPEARAHQVSLFVNAYGLDGAQRAELVDRMIEAAVRGCANDADEAMVTPDFLGPHRMVWGMAWQTRGGRWILDHRRLLEEAVAVVS